MACSFPHVGWRRALIALLPAIALGPANASATVVKALTLKEKTEVAKVVVRAAVERVESEWEVPGASICTRITVRVLETVKGGMEIGQRLTIRQGGGQIG